MVSRVGGAVVGKQKRGIAKENHAMLMTLQTPPSFPTLNLALLIAFLPSQKEIVIGTRLEHPRQMTLTDENAENAAVEPKYTHPSTICTAVERKIALMGSSSFGFTFLITPLNGMALSRANAHVRRLAAVVHPIPENIPWSLVSSSRHYTHNPLSGRQ